MSQRLVQRVSRVVDRKSSRRGFLSRSAVGATAMAVAPAAYALKPTTAYAAICNCSGFNCDCNAQCCDGYTEFCCLLTGQNLCPPNTVVAGWWKADGSGYCDTDGPRPRYYMDCNRKCAPGCGCGSNGVCSSACAGSSCGCAQGSCSNRKSDCTRFRYGQCSQSIKCVGPILCRIITCVPPWSFDASCTTAVARDNNTRFHDRACLHNGFTDLAPGAFYRAAVDWAIARDVITPYSNDIFGPEESVPRAGVASVLWRYEGRVDPINTAPFSDVDPNGPDGKAVAWMTEVGLTKGTSATTFSPTQRVTRAEMVTFLWRMAGKPKAGQASAFIDVPPSSFFAGSSAWAAEAGITKGITPTRFAPDLTLTRAEVVTFLYRFDQIASYIIGSSNT